MKKPMIGILAAALLFLSGCLKDAGTGGTSSVTGKIYAYDYNAEMTNLRAQYYAPDEDVFIIYGDDSVVSDQTRTSFDGSYRFDYLRAGSYTVFAYSKNITTKLPPPVAVIRTVEVTGERQVVRLDDIEINK
jgi:hypothetical protein